MRKLLPIFIAFALGLALTACSRNKVYAASTKKGQELRMQALKDANAVTILEKQTIASKRQAKSQTAFVSRNVNPVTGAPAGNIPLDQNLNKPIPPEQKPAAMPRNPGGLQFRNPDVTKSLPQEKDLKPAQ